jgi:signal transduction histidine kinase
MTNSAESYAGRMSLIDWVRRPLASDLALVAVVLVMELPGALSSPTPKSLLVAPGAAAAIGPSRRAPVPAAVVIGGLELLGRQAPDHDAPVSATLLVLYQVGRYAPPAWTAVVGAAALAILLWFTLSIAPDDLLMGVSVTVVPVLPVAVGYIVRLRGELTRRREQQAAEQAVREERRRIARELHDVIAHHISVVSLYMGVARRTLESDPERSRRTLLTGEQNARQAMSEMRQLLHMLRTDGEDLENHADIGVARLPALVDSSGGASLEITGDAVELPATVDHAVYRIVQEALTNTRKHAAGARSRVLLAYLPSGVEVEVTDDGPAKPGAGLGLGLAGMAERVSLAGGELNAGPGPQGGFVVHARIPLPEER